MTLEQILTFAKLNGTLLSHETWEGKSTRRDNIQYLDKKVIVITYDTNNASGRLIFTEGTLIDSSEPQGRNWVHLTLNDIENMLHPS